MKFENNVVVEPEFADLFEFNDDSNEINHNATMIMFKFLSEIEKVTDNKLSKKALSKLIGTSASYITQLFRGNKIINLETLAKFEKALDIEFKISAISDANKVVCGTEQLDITSKRYHTNKGVWVFHNFEKENIYNNRHIHEVDYNKSVVSNLKIVA